MEVAEKEGSSERLPGQELGDAAEPGAAVEYE